MAIKCILTGVKRQSLFFDFLLVLLSLSRSYKSGTNIHTPVQFSSPTKMKLTFLLFFLAVSQAKRFNQYEYEDYDDFSEVPQFLKRVYDIPKVKNEKLVDLLLPPKKRYRKPFVYFLPCYDNAKIENDETVFRS